MSKTDAAYMRAYRARKKAEHAAYDLMKPTIGAIKMSASKRIRELEAEVRHLKEELAKRPDAVVVRVGGKVVDALDLTGGFTLEAGGLPPIEVPGHLDAPGHQFNSRPFTPAPKKGK